MAKKQDSKRDAAAPAHAARRGIQSVEVGLRIIEALRVAQGPQTLKELSTASRIHASNCHRYLVSFARFGFVTQDPATGRYDLGPKILQAGLAAMSRLDSVAIGLEAMNQLVERTGRTALLAIWEGSSAVIIRWMPGRTAVRSTLSVGATMPLLSTATGSVFLAYLPRHQTDAAVAREAQAGSCINPEALAERVRKAGIGQVSGQHIPGLSAVAAPVLDNHGDAAVVLTMVGLSDGFTQEEIDALRAICADASARLGWVQAMPPSEAATTGTSSRR